jgi:hypothetical protein
MIAGPSRRPVATSQSASAPSAPPVRRDLPSGEKLAAWMTGVAGLLSYFLKK